MPDLHDWITQRIDATEAVARAAEGRIDEAMGEFYITEAEAHLELHSPAAVLRRCEADRRVLARHRLNPDAYWADAARCDGCGTEGEMDYARTENLNDCPELLDLGYAHGLTDEILAGLDRPKEGERPERTGPSLIPDALVEGMYARLWASIVDARTIEPRPEVKALEILDPELKKIAWYVPMADDQL